MSSRLRYFAKNPKRTAGALATLLVAAGVTVGSGAYFTDTSSSTGNSITAGKFDIAMFGSGAPSADGSIDSGAGGCNDLNATACADTATTSTTEATPIFNLVKWYPGAPTVTRHFTVTNNSTVPALISFSPAVTGDANLAAATKVTVTDSTGATVLPATALSATSWAAFAPRLAAGATKTYTMTIKTADGGAPSSPTADDNALQLKTLTLNITANGKTPTSA